MMKLPKHILSALMNNQTSLGEHPAFPPEEEEKFSVNIIATRYDEVSKGFENSDIPTLQNELSELINKCIELEEPNKSALEKLCFDIVDEFYQIPDGVVNIETNIVPNVNKEDQRMLPEKTVDFTFDDINDMNNLTDEIYKRRILNSLIAGASLYYINIIDLYAEEISKINPELLNLYKRILDINNYLLYAIPDNILNKNNLESGRVDVYLQTAPNKSTIKAKGLIFPLLLRETMKGILELSIANGLPNDHKKAEYILKKADFRLAENWDDRFGFCLWSIIANTLNDLEIEPTEIGIHFILMELSSMKINTFNKALQNIFKRTKKGFEILNMIVNNINYDKDEEEFLNQIRVKNKEYQINDNEDLTSDELLNETDKDTIF